MNGAISQVESTVPSYLAGTLLLRGRVRVVATIIIVAVSVPAAIVAQDSLGHASNAATAVAAFWFAWMWGRGPGFAVAFVLVMANHQLGEAMGFEHPSRLAVIADALGIAMLAFLVGHVGYHLERALGARARADLAFNELEHVARDRMLRITDRVPVGLYRTTPEGRITGGNEALMGILGYTDQSSMLKANVWDHYVRPEDRERRVGGAVADDGEWREFELKRADGKNIWVRDWSRAVTDSAGGIVFFDGVLEDITDQRMADELFRAAFEDSPYGMSISSADGRVVRGNAAIAELIGRDLGDMVNIHFSQFTFEGEMEVTPAALEKAARGEVVRYEKRLRRDDGSSFRALISLAPIRDSCDPPLFISHVIDITELRAASEALENLVRSKDELIASVSHELRTPLTVVHGLAQELDSGWMSFSIPEQKEFIGLIAQQSAEVAHIVEDLLVAARADIGKLPIVVASVDIRDQLESALSAVPELEVAVEWVDEVAPLAFADATRVRQIIRNLLVNAKRYGGPEVCARFGSNDQHVWLEIRDNGVGIPEDAISDIFEPYNRAHNAIGQPSSVGLGLTVSRKLAVLMGGTIEYRPEPGWSCFRLELPVVGLVRVSKPTESTGR